MKQLQWKPELAFLKTLSRGDRFVTGRNIIRQLYPNHTVFVSFVPVANPAYSTPSPSNMKRLREDDCHCTFYLSQVGNRQLLYLIILLLLVCILLQDLLRSSAGHRHHSFVSSLDASITKASSRESRDSLFYCNYSRA
jgi:hypothetical protein